LSPLPVPRPAESTVVAAPAPGAGPGHWAGAPSALAAGGELWLAYRERDPGRRGGRVVLARRGGRDPVLAIDREHFGAESLERSALAVTRDGRWRLYASCATPGGKHWRIELLEAATPERLGDASPRTVLPGDERTAVKDPVIRRAGGRWHAWICCHPLDEPGEEDRMHTRYATSDDGVRWTWHGPALTPRPGAWDARGARVTAVLAGGAYYDGRASAAENFHERTGLATMAAAGSLRAAGDAPVAAVRYVDAVVQPDGARRLFYEAPRADGAHELRTQPA
jgi:hypothetical protein